MWLGRSCCDLSCCDTMRQIWIKRLSGFQMFCGMPKPCTISFMQVKGIEKMYDYITSNGWDQITEIRDLEG